MSWKEEILEAFKQGKTVQISMSGNHWRDFIPQNQIDVPNVEYGKEENWRIKPDHDAEREQLLKDSGRDESTPMMKTEQPWEEKKYSKDEMLLFAGFCVGRKRINPTASGADLWEAWETDFPHE